MKKIILPFFVWTLAASAILSKCFAAPVDVNAAKTIATNFYKSNSHNSITDITLAFTERANDGSPAYYVFNINNNDGFVIVTADDAALPVLGYATKGRYDIYNIAPATAAWLENKRQEISYIRYHNLPATEKAKSQWQTLQTAQSRSNARTSSAVVGPLLTTVWNQLGTYSALCPHAWTAGCTAAAMAQIMKYYGFPLHGRGSVTYDDSTKHCYDDSAKYCFTENIGILTADFGNSTYNWSAMPDDATVVDTAVATLIYQCAVSVYTDFNPFGSSANMIPYDSLAWKDPYGGKVCSQAAYVQFFGYDSTMYGLQKNAYTVAAWDSILENEFNNYRVVQYGAYTDSTKTNGHTWVFDGYDANNYFHMNWGWGGLDNGYYNIDSLNANGNKLNTYDEALIGIQPGSTAGITENHLQNAVNIYPNPTSGRFTISGLQFPVSDVEVYNLLGEKVYQSANKLNYNSTVDLSSQPAGVYFVRLLSGETTFNAKLVIE